MSEISQKSSKPFQTIRGFPFPIINFFTSTKFGEVLDLVPRDGDLIILCYPKTGSTWMQYIVLQILSEGGSLPSLNKLLYKDSPYVGLTGNSAVEAQGKHRFYKIHIPYDKIKENPKSKYIYTYRHPEDTLVSFYYFYNNMNRENPLELSEFFEHFLTGEIGFGSYFEHVSSFYKNHEKDNLLMVSYEKLLSNKRQEVLRIAKFLGEEHYKKLLDDGQLLNKIIENTNFDFMKKKLHEDQCHADHTNVCYDAEGKIPVELTKNIAKETDFFRKGAMGEGKIVLTNSQRQRLKEAAEKVLKDTSIFKEWYSNGSD